MELDIPVTYRYEAIIRFEPENRARSVYFFARIRDLLPDKVFLDRMGKEHHIHVFETLVDSELLRRVKSLLASMAESVRNVMTVDVWQDGDHKVYYYSNDEGLAEKAYRHHYLSIARGFLDKAGCTSCPHKKELQYCLYHCPKELQDHTKHG